MKSSLIFNSILAVIVVVVAVLQLQDRKYHTFPPTTPAGESITTSDQGMSTTTFAQDGTEEEPICASVLPERVDDTAYPLPFSCREDMGKDEGMLTFTFTGAPLSDDSVSIGELHVLRGDKEIFTLGTSEKTAIEIVNFWEDKNVPHFRLGSVKLRDVTFDGYKDLAVLVSGGAYNFTTKYYAYDPQLHTFKKDAILEVTNEGVDLEHQTVSSFYKSRGLGDMYGLETYTFINGSYVLTKREVQDAVDYEHAEEKGYVRTTEELKNGKLVVTKKEYIPYKDVFKQ